MVCTAAWPELRLPAADQYAIRGSRSWMAEPSARNSGLETMSKWTPLALSELRMHSIASAVRTGRVLFSTTIFDEVAFSRI